MNSGSREKSQEEKMEGRKEGRRRKEGGTKGQKIREDRETIKKEEDKGERKGQRCVLWKMGAKNLFHIH